MKRAIRIWRNWDWGTRLSAVWLAVMYAGLAIITTAFIMHNFT